ncbi:ParB/RepB/Spo0J family partition protein [Achromobacter sp. LC458]|jgi:ParB family chromosome partitioning protein|uniref:ParB/RepB/Spo0J family partition protein n=1 Tax=Achromobacter TaxID=222 RepID=UPI000629E142|nr:ParB/RepB/Spo0J family partition protein [Achromobacter sp. LC458]TRM51893.1 ParB/RepB/Spo0J family partition protein [Achromobacter sp. LC458]
MKIDSKELAAIHAASIRTEIPHSQLRLSESYQARRPLDPKKDPELSELKATIKAMGGLLQNLVVVACADGFYEVCAGGRRWAALGLLIEDAVFPADYSVSCLVIPAEYAHHASLIENIARKAMHPADVYESYARMRAEKNWTIEAIAAAHGATESAVKKLLALGAVSPKLMQLFRDGKIEVADMQALASVSDHARQEAAWKAAQSEHWNRDVHIRNLLAETEMLGDSAVARYVTVAAYEKAGGEVRRDLFENDTYLADPDMARTMALAKMQRSKLFKAISTEGWLWVECRVSFAYDDKKQFGEIQRAHLDPSKAQAKQIEALEKKVSIAQEKLDGLRAVEGYDESDLDRVRALIRGYEGEIRAIRTELFDYPIELKALSGAVLHLDYEGGLTATRGLIRKDERETVAQILRSTAGAGEQVLNADLPPVETRPVHSEALTNRLQAQRVIALQAEIIARPNLALCLLIEQMLGDFDGSQRSGSGDSFDLSLRPTHHELANTDADIKNSPAWARVHEQIEAVTKNVPEDDAAVLPWLLAQPQADLIELLAVLTSISIYRRQSHSYGAEPRHLDRLGELVGLDMSKWWKPTAQSYLAHVSKDRIAAVVTDAVGAEQAKPLLAMKKAQAATAAEQLLDGKGWVPELMRGKPLLSNPEPISQEAAAGE